MYKWIVIALSILFGYSYWRLLGKVARLANRMDKQDAFLRETKTGGILTGSKIEDEVQKGNIYISDFDESRINPNSYNVSVGDTVMLYQNMTSIDLHDPDTYKDTVTFEIPEEGFKLRPGLCYLVPTKEVIGSDMYEPIITGRSSFGRMGNRVHQEAGFADIGYHGTLTMQIKVTYPTIIYKGDVIAQVYFLTPYGSIDNLYRGRYQNSTGPVSSKLGESWSSVNMEKDE